MNRRDTYPRAPGQPCIYCAERIGTITEHIIAEAFGGRLMLENASCEECAAQTHAFEGHAGRMFVPLRRQLNIRGKRRSTKERLLRRTERFILRLDGIRSIKVPLHEFPGFALHMSFLPPTILFGLQPTEGPLTASVHHIEFMPNFVERLNEIGRKYRAKKVDLLGIDNSPDRLISDDFGRTLAKTAHSYAVAVLGYSSFIPLVTHIIRDQRPFYLPHFIGSALGEPNPPTDMHEIEIGDFGWNAPEFVIVRLRIFANLNSQAHYVVVGRR